MNVGVPLLTRSGHRLHHPSLKKKVWLDERVRGGPPISRLRIRPIAADHHHKRYSTDGHHASKTGFCFDIDGVLKQGSRVLPQARLALNILTGQNSLQEQFPFVLCTNGGGIHELERSQKLSKELGVPIATSQLVQSHTIFTRFLNTYRHQPILVIGGVGQKCRLVAERYGFQNVYTPKDILKWNPSIWPFHKLSEEEVQMTKIADFSTIPFRAIFVMHDSFNWGLDIQIAIDLLTSRDGIITNPMEKLGDKHIPIFFSAPDIIWGNEFSRPRFGQGAFQTALRANYQELTGCELDSWTGGKPHRATYDFADNLLQNLMREKFGSKRLGNVYMIGDNPASDIQGANNYGWSSVLVKTGVFKGSQPEEAAHVPTAVKDDVLEAVKWALAQEGYPDLG